MIVAGAISIDPEYSEQAVKIFSEVIEAHTKEATSRYNELLDRYT
jgi:hypothetical protein